MPLQTPRHLTKSGSVSQHQGHHQGHALSQSAQCQTDQYKTVQRHSAHSAHYAYDAHHAQHISTNKPSLLDGGLEITATQKAKYTDALDMSKELSGGIGGDAYHCPMSLLVSTSELLPRLVQGVETTNPQTKKSTSSRIHNAAH